MSLMYVLDRHGGGVNAFRSSVYVPKSAQTPYSYEKKERSYYRTVLGKVIPSCYNEIVLSFGTKLKRRGFDWRTRTH